MYVFILSMIFARIPHYFIVPPLSALRFPAALFTMFPMTLKAFRSDRFRFLPELFTINSRRFYHHLSTGKESITLHALHRSVVVAFIRLVQGQRAIAPAVYQLRRD
jgi:hypothetical protein